MFPTDLKTWILFILVTVVLGAIGSGLWDTALKPFVSATSRILLRILTFGKSSAINSIYRDIARRFLQKPTVFLLSLIAFISWTLLGGTASVLYLKSFGGDEQRINETTKLVMNKTSSVTDLDKKKEAIREEFDKMHLESERKLASIIFLLMLFATVTTVYHFIKNAYIISAILFFDQCLAVCLPYIDNETERIFLSDFAQIKSKSDYRTVINKLEEISKQNNIELPRFVML